MSLTADGFTVGAAFAIAVGSAIQARQAYTELDEKITGKLKFLRTLLVAVIGAWFSITMAQSIGGVVLTISGLRGETLTPGGVTVLPPALAAVLAAKRATALTADQEAALAEGKPIHLTPGQIAAMNAELAKDMKRWLNWFLGWVFILVGALAALFGAALMLATDL